MCLEQGKCLMEKGKQPYLKPTLMKEMLVVEKVTYGGRSGCNYGVTTTASVHGVWEGCRYCKSTGLLMGPT